MPTYDYHCDACSHDFEEFQSFSEPLLTKCPKCGKKKLRRLFGTGAGVIFKGSGFYETDYRSDSYKEAAKADTDKSSAKSDDKRPAAGESGKTGTSDQTSGSAGETKSKETGKSSKSGSRASDK